MGDLLSNPVNNPIVIPPQPLATLVRTFNIGQAAVLSQPVQNDYQGKIPQTNNTDPVLYQSPISTPVYTDITFESVTYKDFVSGKTITTQKQTYITVLINVSQAKKIIKTEIQGRNGTVKEYIGMDDYGITINGIIAGPNGSYPKAIMLQLKKIIDAPVPIPVTSTYLNNLGIFNIVVESYSFDQEPGGYSKQNFTISAISDLPVELQIS